MVESIVTVVLQFLKCLAPPIERRFGYLRNYKANVENLKAEIDKLKDERRSIQHRVSEAERKGEKIEEKVEKWLVRANNTIEQSAKFIDDEETTNKRCLMGLCPNLKSGYQLSKEAETKVKAIVELKEEAGKFDDRISYRTIPEDIWLKSHKGCEAFESRLSTLKAIQNALIDVDVSIIGVYGMGGIGKTTLVKEFARRAIEDKLYDKVAFSEVTQSPDIKKIQEEIAETLGLQLSEEAESRRAGRLYERLKNEKKILVILDNIWKPLDLGTIGIPFGVEHRGCKLLFTTRDLDVLLRMESEKNFSIGILNEQEAWRLFKIMAGDYVENRELESTATSVAKACGGLPIALTTVAKALRKKELPVWKNALQELQTPSEASFDEGVPAEAYSTIELSYQYLRDSIINDIPEGSESLQLELLLMSPKNSFAVPNIPENFFKRTKKLRVLDLTRMRLLSLPSSIGLLVNLQTLCLNQSIFGGIDIAIIGKLENLEILSFLRSDIVELPKALGQLTKLRLLDLTDCFHLKVIAPNVISSLIRLEELYMGNCSIEWEVERANSKRSNASLDELMHLPRLTTLEIDVKNYSILPEGFLARKLERFKISIGNESFIHPMIAGQNWFESQQHFLIDSDRKSLRELKLKFDFMDICSMKLQGINNVECLWLDKLQGIENVLFNLDTEGFSQLKLLWVQNNPDFFCIVDSRAMVACDAFPLLESLILHNLINMERIWIDQLKVESFNELKIIQAYNCDKLSNIFWLSTVVNHSSTVVNCSKMKEIFAIGEEVDNSIEKIELAQLRYLSLGNLPEVTSFCREVKTPSASPNRPASQEESTTTYSSSEITLDTSTLLFNEKVALPNLEALEISAINVDKIWHYNQIPAAVFPRFQNLTRLIVWHCNKLKYIFSASMIGSLKHLQHLEVRFCEDLQEIISENRADEVIPYFVFPQLTTLILQYLPKLRCLYPGMHTSEWPALEIFSVFRCDKLKIFAADLSQNNENDQLGIPAQQPPCRWKRSEAQSSSRRENPDYIDWKKTDKLLQSWMLSSMADNVLIMSKARYMPLKMQIQTIKKGAMSVSDYFNKMKKIADSLGIGGNPLASTDFIMHLLTGLDENYESLVTTILARLEKDSLIVEEVYSLMLSHETRVEMSKGKVQNELVHDMLANFSQKGQNYNKFNNASQRGFNGGNFTGMDNGKGGYNVDKEVICQICFIPGHGAYKCRNRFSQNFIPRQGRGGFRPRGGFNYRGFPGQSQNMYGKGYGGFYGAATSTPRYNTPMFQGNVAYQNANVLYPQGFPLIQGQSNVATPFANYGVVPPTVPTAPFAPTAPVADYGVVADPAWYIDSGATNHVTKEAGIFSSYSVYHGIDKLHVGNGMGLHIKHVGCTILNTLAAKPIYLNNILHVPAITKNLLSVSKLLADNDVVIEFHKTSCFVKDKNSGIILLKGIARGGLYQVEGLVAVSHAAVSNQVQSNALFVISNSSPISSVCSSPVSMISHSNVSNSIHSNEVLSAVNNSQFNNEASIAIIYISNHVTFDESCFPFQSGVDFSSVTHSCSSSDSSSQSSSVCPLIQLDITKSSSSTAADLGFSLFSPSSSSQTLIQSPLPTVSSPTEPSTSLVHHLTPPLPSSTGHPMVTRSKAGIFKPKAYLTTPPTKPTEPTTVSKALQDPTWHQAMTDEYQALLHNHTWTLVKPTHPIKAIGNKWVFRIKYNPDGSVSRYKARLVAKGFHQTQGLDFNETFSPVIKSSTIRIILSMAVMNHWVLRQIDINNAFLNGHLTEEAPRAWFDRLKLVLTTQWGFTNSISDTSLFFKRTQGHLLLILVYVNDIIITGSNSQLVQQIIINFQSAFALKDLGALNYFLGVQVLYNKSSIHLSQSKYITDLLDRVQMQDSTPCSTPVVSGVSLTKGDSESFSDVTLYRSTIGALQYATLTRPEIAFSVNKLSQFLSSPTVNHWQACKRILRYLKGTIKLGLQFYNHGSFQIDCFSDADWAGDKDDRRSVAGYCVYMGPNLVSWCSKKQAVVSRSSAESEYRALAMVAAEVLWIRSLLTEIGITLSSIPIIWCDNQSAVALASNPKFHSRTKHIELDVHFIREKVAPQCLKVQYISSSEQNADILTKALSYHLMGVEANKNKFLL
ncbi:Disease resistance protein [Citrus sinensis]|nr:Disease resistance protein [Citrus sinensis]